MAGLNAYGLPTLTPLQKQTADDRAALARIGGAVSTGVQKLGAAATDVMTLPARAIAGVANTALRLPNALGAGIPYIPESVFGGNSASMTPVMDRLNRSLPQTGGASGDWASTPVVSKTPAAAKPSTDAGPAVNTPGIGLLGKDWNWDNVTPQQLAGLKKFDPETFGATTTSAQARGASSGSSGGRHVAPAPVAPVTRALPTLTGSPHFVDAEGNEDVFQTSQGQQIIYTGQGPMVNGVLTPHSVIAAGMAPQFLQAASEGQVAEANKIGAKTEQELAVEAIKAASAANVAGINAAAQNESSRITAGTQERIEGSRSSDIRKQGTPVYDEMPVDPNNPFAGTKKVFRGMVQIGTDNEPKFTPLGSAPAKAPPKVGDGYNAPDGTYGKYKVKDKKIVGVN